MVNFKDCPKFNVYDDYYTPEWVWNKIRPLVSKDKVIFEACMLNSEKSKSIEIWKNWGYKVVGNKKWDILTCDIPDCDIIITNPPFETKIKQKILKRLMEINKPFIIIMNSCNIFSNYFREILNTNDIQIIFPKGHLHFQKEGEKEKKRTSFYSVFVSYKMNLENKDLWV